jgi:hypothetical protein
MKDVNADRRAEERALAAEFKEKLAGLDRYVPAVPPFSSIEPRSGIRWAPSRRGSARPALRLRTTAAAVAMLFLVALVGSWGLGSLHAARDASTSGASDATAVAIASPTNSLGASDSNVNSPEASASHTIASEGTVPGGPSVVRFQPADGGTTGDTHQPVSVRFNDPMNRPSTEAASSVTVNSHPLAAEAYWTENDTVLEFIPAQPFKVGDLVTLSVASSAMDTNGRHLTSPESATFAVVDPVVAPIPTGGTTTSTGPWHASEVYYLALMNCTRTGGWVTSDGECSSDTNHTLPAQSPLVLDEGISDKVARPYARELAERGILDHWADHDPAWRLCYWGGLCGGAWGENLASPGSYGENGMIAIELFYQNESSCRCEHYYNIMNPSFHRVGVGIWVGSTGLVRVVLDFYE